MGRSPRTGTLESEAPIFLSSPMASMFCCRCIPTVCGPSPVRIHVHTHTGDIYRTPTRVPTHLSLFGSISALLLCGSLTRMPQLSIVPPGAVSNCSESCWSCMCYNACFAVILKYASDSTLVASFFNSLNASSWSSPHMNF